MEPSFRSFDQDSIDDSSQITLYSKLIDIIENDVERIASENSRQGLSIWGILGSIVTGVAFFLGRTSQVDEIPVGTTEVACTSLIFFYLIWAIYNFLSGGGGTPKPGRLISHKDFLKGRIFFIVLRGVILAILSFSILNANFTQWSQWVTVILIFIPILLLASSVTAMKITKMPFGNQRNWITYSALGISLLCYLIPLIILVNQLSFPIGKSLSDAFSIGLTMSIVVVLFELLLSLASTSPSVDEYLDLRDDIILREIALNDALARYRIIREGKSSWDELQFDFQEIMGMFRHHEAILDEQIGIIKRQVNASPDEFIELSKSFMVHVKSHESNTSNLVERYQRFLERLRMTLSVTGDAGTDYYIRNELDSALSRLREKESAVAQANSRLFQEKAAGKIRNEIREGKQLQSKRKGVRPPNA